MSNPSLIIYFNNNEKIFIVKPISVNNK